MQSPPDALFFLTQSETSPLCLIPRRPFSLIIFPLLGRALLEPPFLPSCTHTDKSTTQYGALYGGRTNHDTTPLAMKWGQVDTSKASRQHPQVGSRREAERFAEGQDLAEPVLAVAG